MVSRSPSETKNTQLDVSDINDKNQKFLSKRVTNPLNPSYEIPSGSGRKLIQIGKIERNQPRENATASKSIKDKFELNQYQKQHEIYYRPS